MLLLALLLGAATVSGSVSAAEPPHGSSGVEYWGQPSRSAEAYGRPLGNTLGLFASARLAARLPAPTGLMQPLAVTAARMRGHPGKLILAETHRVATPLGSVYLVPTVRGWLCVQGPTSPPTFQTCHRGLLRQGVTWSYYTTPTGLDIIGVAANDVRAIDLVWDTKRRRARLGHNVFYVHRPLSLAAGQHLPPLGHLSVSYDDRRRSAITPLR